MSGLNLIPTDLVTQQMLVEVLTAMVKHHIATKKVAATHESLRPSLMHDTLSTPIEIQPASTPSLYPIKAGVNYEQHD